MAAAEISPPQNPFPLPRKWILRISESFSREPPQAPLTIPSGGGVVLSLANVVHDFSRRGVLRKKKVRLHKSPPRPCKANLARQFAACAD